MTTPTGEREGLGQPPGGAQDGDDGVRYRAVLLERVEERLPGQFLSDVGELGMQVQADLPGAQRLDVDVGGLAWDGRQLLVALPPAGEHDGRRFGAGQVLVE